MPPAAPRPPDQRVPPGAMHLSRGSGRARGAAVGALRLGEAERLPAGSLALAASPAPLRLRRALGLGAPAGARLKPGARPPRRLSPAPAAPPRGLRGRAEGRTPATTASAPGDFSPGLAHV